MDLTYKNLTIKQRQDLNKNNKTDLDDRIVDYWMSLCSFEDKSKFEEFLKVNLNTSISSLKNIYSVPKDLFFNENSELNSNKNQIENLVGQDFIDNKHIFNTYFSPFIGFFREQYRDRIEVLNLENIFISKYLKNNLEEQLLIKLTNISYKVLIFDLEINKIDKKLVGEDKEQRYQSYCSKFNYKFNYNNFIKEYPVLFELMINTVNLLVSNVEDIICKLDVDFNELLSTRLTSIDINEIIEIDCFSGDTHNNGKSVAIILFNNNYKIVYKPRDLSLDYQFNSFVKLVSNNLSTKLKTYIIVNKKEYGWVEYIQYESCQDMDQVNKFYKRLGSLLGIIYTLNATDFHFENIIASGENPVLIDLESLFHHAYRKDHDLTPSDSVNRAMEIIKNSVISTGLLPQIRIKIKGKDFDFSGISDTENKISPYKFDIVMEEYTDEMKVNKDFGQIKKSNNIPFIINQKINLDSQINFIEEGFSEVYDFIKNNKDIIVNELNLFSGLRIRRILRNTMDYGKILNLSYHPDFYRNKIDRELLFSRFSIENPIKEEKDILLKNDIPYFYTYTDSKNLYGQTKIYNDFYNTSGLKNSIQKVKNFNNDDKKIQLNMIKSSISGNMSYQNELIRNYVTQSEYSPIKLAEYIGQLISEDMIVGNTQRDSSWVGINMDGNHEEDWQYSVVGMTLYDGNCGIALYYLYLFKVTHDIKYKDMAYKAIQTVELIVEEMLKSEDLTVGAFEGICSPVYVLHHFWKVCNDHQKLEKCLRLVKHVEKCIHNDCIYDIVGGSAGALQVITNFYEDYPEESILKVIIKIKDHLLNNIQKESFWLQIHKEKQSPYVGFSHGGTGIASALSFYYKTTQDKSVLKTIKKVIEYEDLFYSNEKNNWYSEHLNSFPNAWCHGAAGILLGRFNIYKNTNVIENFNTLYQNCINTSSKTKNTNFTSLCHGELGIQDILYTIGHINNINLDQIIRESIDRNYCKTYGIMNGLSGYGYGILRLLYPEHVPSILNLEKPI